MADETEVAEFVGCHPMTIRSWRLGGLLANPQRPTLGIYLYLRADLRRVMRSPRYKSRGVDYRALRAELERAVV